MKALSFGSLNIDHTYKVSHFVQKGETLSSELLQDFSGGKGLNQSVALARAGLEVYHAGAIGKDGLFLLEELQSAGVDTSLVQIREDVATGHAIIQIDESGDNCILLYGGANQSITIEYIDMVLSYFSKGDMILLQNEINNLSYIIEQASRKEMKVILNPSPMNEKIWKMPLEKINLFILNEVEASQLLTIESEKEDELIKGLCEKFPEAEIVLTLGERGSIYAGTNGNYRQESVKTEVVDTTAAGDTFTGYFLSGMANGDTIAKTMEKASKAAAIAINRKGAATSIPTLDEVENAFAPLEMHVSKHIGSLINSLE